MSIIGAAPTGVAAGFVATRVQEQAAQVAVTIIEEITTAISWASGTL